MQHSMPACIIKQLLICAHGGAAARRERSYWLQCSAVCRSSCGLINQSMNNIELFIHRTLFLALEVPFGCGGGRLIREHLSRKPNSKRWDYCELQRLAVRMSVLAVDPRAFVVAWTHDIDVVLLRLRNNAWLSTDGYRSTDLLLKLWHRNMI